MSFHNLIKIVGLSPSELPRDQLMTRLSEERDRVRRTIEWFRSHAWVAKPKKPKKAKKGGKPVTKVTTKMKKAGVTMEQMELALKQLEEEGRVK